MFRYKDLPGWWSNLHYNRIGGVEQAQPTAWVPMSKPFHFTELGCGAVDKGPNQPNLFRDPKSAENGIPHFSNGGRSDLAQYRFLLAHHLHWQEGGEEANPTSPVYGGRMVDPDALSVWAWDLRPFPAFPVQKEVWGDGENWICGHWLNGRLNAIPVGALIDRIMADFGLPAAATSRADGMVSGYVIANPTTARAALEPIVELFGISVRSQGDRLVFATEGMEQTDTIPAGDLVIPDEGDVLARITISPAKCTSTFATSSTSISPPPPASIWPGPRGRARASSAFRACWRRTRRRHWLPISCTASGTGGRGSPSPCQ